jgi:molybdopterin-synthase adenylyltransferase
MLNLAKQLIFEKIGPEKQKLISKSTVAIVGVGALGTHSAEMLTRSGVKELILVDRDLVEDSNLQRQSLFAQGDIKKLKVKAAEERLLKINPKLKIKAHSTNLDHTNIDIIKADIVLDCTDNFETKFLINEYCKKNNLPWVFASVAGSIGMMYMITPKIPCFRCIFNEPEEALSTCDREGIVNTIVATVSAFQVTEALKYLSKQPTTKELIYYDLWKHKLTKIKVKKRTNCQTCNKNYEYLSGDKVSEIITLCGQKKYQIKGKAFNLKKINKQFKKTTLGSGYLKFKDLTLFEDGRAVITTDSKEKAKSIYDGYFG